MRPRLRKPLILAVNLLGLLVLAACIAAATLLLPPESLSARYRVAVRDPRSERIEVEVELEIQGVRRPRLLLSYPPASRTHRT